MGKWANCQICKWGNINLLNQPTGYGRRSFQCFDASMLQYFNACLFIFFLTTFVSAQSAGNWPSFRGQHASGVMDQQDLPTTWDVDSGKNIRWKTAIPGLSHASPIIWDDVIYMVSAISSMDSVGFKHGLYGAGTASSDRSLHKWVLIAVDKESGKINWQSIATEGIPIDKRHVKATYANSTPVTDGRYIVAWFGSQGAYAFNMDGTKVWERDLGRMDVGAYDAPAYEWGVASSPIIYQDLVILQCDTQGESFLIALDIHSGKTVWQVDREELPSWGTPTIYPDAKRPQLITNGSVFIRSYNPADGSLLWQLGGSSKITAPTPIFKEDIIVVASGRRPEKPIFAVRADAKGDITLGEKQTANNAVLWSKTRRGPYMPTPIIYGNYVYTLQNQGILDCFDLESGEELYRQRLTHRGGGFSASPVASDGRLYLPGEDGDVFVVEAGATYKELAVNSIGELQMASPAISAGTLYLRGERHLFAIVQE